MSAAHRLHEVEAVTIIESLIPAPQHRASMHELNDVAALEGAGMDPAIFTRLQAVQYQVLRTWRR